MKNDNGLMQLNRNFDAILDVAHEDEFDKHTDVSSSQAPDQGYEGERNGL